MFTALIVISLIAGRPTLLQDSRAGERIAVNTLTVSGTGEAKAPPDVAYVTVGVLTALVWFTFVSQIYIAQFLNHHPVVGWLNQPLVQLPSFHYIPDALKKAK